jgi:hypothetical protein
MCADGAGGLDKQRLDPTKLGLIFGSVGWTNEVIWLLGGRCKFQDLCVFQGNRCPVIAL